MFELHCKIILIMSPGVSAYFEGREHILKERFSVKDVSLPYYEQAAQSFETVLIAPAFRAMVKLGRIPADTQ